MANTFDDFLSGNLTLEDGGGGDIFNPESETFKSLSLPKRIWRGTVRPFLEQKPPYLKELSGDVGEQVYSGAVRGLTFNNIKPDIEPPDSNTERFAFQAAHLGGFGTSLGLIGIPTRLAGNPAVLGFVAGALEDTGEDVGSKADLTARGKAGAWMGAQLFALGKAGDLINKTVTDKLLTGILSGLAKDPGKAAIVRRLVSDGILGSGLGAIEATEHSKLTPEGFKEMVTNALIGGGSFVAGSSLGEQIMRPAASNLRETRRTVLGDTITKATQGPDIYGAGAYAPPGLMEFNRTEYSPGPLRQIFPLGFESARTEVFGQELLKTTPYLPQDVRNTPTGQALNIPSTRLDQDIQQGKPVPESIASKTTEPQGGVGDNEIRTGKNAVKLDALDNKLRKLGLGKNKELRDLIKAVPEDMKADIISQLERASNDKEFNHLLSLTGKLGAYTENFNRQNFLDTLKNPRSFDKFQGEDIKRLDALMIAPNTFDKNKFADDMFVNIPTIASEKKLVKEKINLADIAQKEKAKELKVKASKSPAETDLLIRGKTVFDGMVKNQPDILGLYLAGDVTAKEVGMSKQQIGQAREKNFRELAKALGLDPNAHWSQVKKWFDDATQGMDKKAFFNVAEDKDKGIKTKVVTKEVQEASDKADKIIEPKVRKPKPVKAENLNELAYRTNHVKPMIDPVLSNDVVMGDIHGADWDGTNPILKKIYPEIQKAASQAGKRSQIVEYTDPAVPNAGKNTTVIVYDGKKLQAILNKNRVKQSADNFVKKSAFTNFVENTPERRALDEAYGQKRATNSELLAGAPIIEPVNVSTASEKGDIESKSSKWGLENIKQKGMELKEGSIFSYVPIAEGPKKKRIFRTQMQGASDTRPPFSADLYSDQMQALQDARVEHDSSGILLELDGEGLKALKSQGAVQVFAGGKNSTHRIQVTNQTEVPYKTVWITDKADPTNAMAWARKALKEGREVYRVSNASVDYDKAVGFDTENSVALIDSLNALWRQGLAEAQRAKDYDTIPVLSSIAQNVAIFVRNPVNANMTVREAIDEVVYGNLKPDENGAFLQTAEWKKFEENYSAQWMLENLRGQEIFKAGTTVDMNAADSIKTNYYFDPTGPAGIAFRARSYRDIKPDADYIKEVNTQGALTLDADRFAAQMFTFLAKIRGVPREVREVQEGNEAIKTQLQAFDLKTDDPVLRSTAEFYQQKLAEMYHTFKDTDVNGLLKDLEASVKAFNESVAIVQSGQLEKAPISRLMDLRTELKTDLLRMEFEPSKEFTGDLKKLDYWIINMDGVKRQLKWKELFSDASEGSPYVNLLRGTNKVLGAEKKGKTVFQVTQGKKGGYLPKKYSFGYEAHDNQVTRLTKGIEMIDAMISQWKNVLEPASQGVNIFHLGKPVMSQGERADLQSELLDVTEALKQKSNELTRNTNEERAPQIQEEHDALAKRMSDIYARLNGLTSAKGMIHSIPSSPVSGSTELRDITDIYRAKTRSTTGSNWMESVSQWLNSERGMATLSDPSGNMFPLFKRISDSFKGMFSFEPNQPKSREDVLKTQVKEAMIRQGKYSATEDVMDSIRDTTAKAVGMENEARVLVEQKARDLNLAGTFGESIATKYKRKAFNLDYWKDGLSGKMDALMRKEVQEMNPYLIDLKVSLEAIAILDPSKPHIYSFTREADLVNPNTGLSKRETFDNLPSNVKRWIVQHASDYRSLLDKGIEMNFFDDPTKVLDSYYSNGFDHTVPLDVKTGQMMSDAFNSDPSMQVSLTHYRSSKSVLDRIENGMPEVYNPLITFDHYLKDFIRKASATELSMRLERKVASDTGLPLLSYDSGGRTRIGGSQFTSKDLREAGYERLSGRVPMNRFNNITKMRETAWVHPEIKSLLEGEYGRESRIQNPAIRALFRIKSAVKSVTLLNPFDNIMYVIGALNGALGPLETAKITFGPKSWMNWKNNYSEELKMEMAQAGVNTATYNRFLQGFYDNFKSVELAHSPEQKSFIKRSLGVLESVVHEKGGLDEILFKVIDNSSAFMFQRKRDDFMKNGMSRPEAGKLAADYVNTALWVPHDYTFGRHTSEAARWLLISRNMSFARIRLFTGAIDPDISIFGKWFNRNFAHHGLTRDEQSLLQRTFINHILNNAVVFGLGSAMISYWLTQANTGKGIYPWEREDSNDWWRIGTGLSDPKDPNGREIMISNPLMKDFTDVTQFAKVPIDLWTFESPDYILNKSDMTIKSLIEMYAGGKILPRGILDTTPKGAPFNYKVNQSLEHIMVDQGPLNIFKPALDELEDKPTNDPISTAFGILGFKFGKSVGPPGGNAEYIKMQNELDRTKFLKMQANEQLRNAISRGEGNSPEANRLRLILHLSPVQLRNMQLKREAPLFLKTREYLKAGRRRGPLDQFAEDEGF